MLLRVPALTAGQRTTRHLRRSLALLEALGKGLRFTREEAQGIGRATALGWFAALAAAAWLRLERMDFPG